MNARTIEPKRESKYRSFSYLYRIAQQIKPHIVDILEQDVSIPRNRASITNLLQRSLDSIVLKLNIQLNASEKKTVEGYILDDMFGLGPLEDLLRDDSINDIMVNGPEQIYVERNGRLVLTDRCFVNNRHVIQVAQKIVNPLGRRVDEANPICDARLSDGSRINIISTPLAIDGCSISIRKFPKRQITLEDLVGFGTITPEIRDLLQIVARQRLNVIISGGTGSGKTTLLNGLSQHIDPNERIVTIEDAAELNLQKPHVVRLETRPPNLEGKGEVTIRSLVKNALRMRPDRIILGEVRSEEAIDMLQAMNTGHDGSMCTLHANSPRDALVRLENMVLMGSVNLPPKSIRQQIANSVDLVLQVSRLRDGQRKVLSVTEITGIDNETVLTQEIFRFAPSPGGDPNKVNGAHVYCGIRPHILSKPQMLPVIDQIEHLLRRR